jgi:hypothetical protein
VKSEANWYPAPLSVQVSRAWSPLAVASSLGGDGVRKLPEHRAHPHTPLRQPRHLARVIEDSRC